MAHDNDLVFFLFTQQKRIYILVLIPHALLHISTRTPQGQTNLKVTQLNPEFIKSHQHLEWGGGHVRLLLILIGLLCHLLWLWYRTAQNHKNLLVSLYFIFHSCCRHLSVRFLIFLNKMWQGTLPDPVCPHKRSFECCHISSWLFLARLFAFPCFSYYIYTSYSTPSWTTIHNNQSGCPICSYVHAALLRGLPVGIVWMWC